MLTSDEFGGVIRAVVAAIGGVAVTKGLIDQATATAIGGALVTVAVAVWSVYAKRRA